MAIRITGMYSGLDTESIISELVSAKSVKKQNLVKAQTKLSWKQDAWKALNTKIYSFYTNVLDNLRYQGSYSKKTTKVSNSNAITVTTSNSAVDGVRSVKVNQLAKGSNLTSGELMSKDGVRFTGYASLAQLRKFGELDNNANLSGSFRVMGEQGQYFDFEVNENTTINDVVSMIQSTGLNCNYDESSQRIFINSKNTGAANNFHIMANDEGGMNALAALQLLSADDIENNKELQKWADYAKDSGALDKAVEEEKAARKAEYEASNKSLKSANDSLNKKNDSLADANDEYLKNILDWAAGSDEFDTKFTSSNAGSLSDAANKLYGKDGLYDQLQEAKDEISKAQAELDKANNAEYDPEDADEVKAFEDNVKAAEDALKAAQDNYGNLKDEYDALEKEVFDFIDDMVYGPMVEKKDEDGEVVTEKVPVLDEDGNQKLGEDDEPLYEDVPVMVRDAEAGLKAQYEKAQAEGNVSDELKASVDSINNWYDALASLKENKEAITANEAAIAKNDAKIAENDSYLDDTLTVEAADGSKYSKLENEIRQEFQARTDMANAALDALKDGGKYSGLLTASKVEAQDAEIEIDGAKFTSMNNKFSVNGLTLTANEVTDKEITITTSTDTDGIYNMIKNFFKEYNGLINEMNALYNAEASTGYEPLTSEEKEALSESEIEEWEKKIKDSLLRRDSTLSSVSYAMTSVLLQGAVVNGKQMYLSDFGINTLGYFNAKENEKNAYHINGDADDEATKSYDNELKAMISSDPDTVMNFFTKLANNLYDNLSTQMASSTMSSAFTVYNDKQMKSDYNDYTDKITKEEEKLNALMDKWYAKFSQMEVALSKLESKNNSLASILGG